MEFEVSEKYWQSGLD